MSGDESPAPVLRARLILDLQWLAAEPEKTLAALSIPEVIPDDLANDLDSYFEMAEGAGVLSDQERGSVQPILDLMDVWSGAGLAEFWTPESVRTSPIWSDLREMARTALEVFCAPRRDDDLKGRV